MNKSNTIALAVYLIFLLNPETALAQSIIPDSSLPNNTIINTEGSSIGIEGGTNRGGNLFHSFEAFNLEGFETATFENGLDIVNILSRVTGENPSSIDGLIKANGDANLFLINPNGIVFGENAELDIGGTFTAAVADAIVFDGGNFSAVNPSESILTLNLPLGVQLGENNPSLAVLGRGSNVFFDEFTGETIAQDRVLGLSNPSGINLIGSNIDLNGGNLTSESGEINLTAASNGVVVLEGEDSTQNLGEIYLSNAASVSASGDTAGEINISAGSLSVEDGSAILNQTTGIGNKGSINLEVADTISLAGESEFGDFPSYISTDVLSSGTGTGADININTSIIETLFGAQINAATFGSGKGGNLNINAAQVYAFSGGSITSSGYFVDTSGSGDGGEMSVNADLIDINTGAQMGGTSFGSGNGGDININAATINISDLEDLGDDFVFVSELIANAQGTGNAGNINIATESLNISNGGQISTTTFFDSGNAGKISINADTIEIKEDFLNQTGFDTGIISSSGSNVATQDSLGKGGDIDIQANTLVATDGGIISSGSFSGSQGGDISIKVNDLILNSDLSTQTATNGGLILSLARSTGDAGNINIDAQNTILENGSQINASTIASGNAGTLAIDTSSLEISGFTEAGASALISLGIIGSGNGGDINLNADSIEIAEGGTISVSNFSTRNQELPPGDGSAGNINITANNVNIDSQDTATSINASTFSNGGGNINIDAKTIDLTGENSTIIAESIGLSKGGEIRLTGDRLDLFDRANITSSANDLGDAGNIALDIKDLNVSTGAIKAESIVSGGGDIKIDSQNINLNSNSLISTSVKDSNGGGGNISINNTDLILNRNDSDIRANAIEGPGGNIDITSLLIFRDSNSDIDASSKFGLDGNVEISSPESEKELAPGELPQNIIDPTGLIAATCPISKDSSFSYIGNGGIPRTPSSSLEVGENWSDSRGNDLPVSSSSQTLNAPKQEANFLKIKDGAIELVATNQLESLLINNCL